MLEPDTAMLFGPTHRYRVETHHTALLGLKIAGRRA